jgi:hypothetical protein
LNAGTDPYFSFHTLDELLAGLTKSNGSQSATAKSGMGDSMNMSSGSMGAMNMASDMAMDPNDIDYDAFLANDARRSGGHPYRTGRASPAAAGQRCVRDTVLDRSRCAQR